VPLQYYNTNRLDRAALGMAIQENQKQQDMVLAFFRMHPNILFATHQVHELLMPQCRITSTQRCITNLTDDGRLIKTINMINGPMGKQVHTWRFSY